MTALEKIFPFFIFFFFSSSSSARNRFTVMICLLLLFVGVWLFLVDERREKKKSNVNPNGKFFFFFCLVMFYVLCWLLPWCLFRWRVALLFAPLWTDSLSLFFFIFFFFQKPSGSMFYELVFTLCKYRQIERDCMSLCCCSIPPPSSSNLLFSFTRLLAGADCLIGIRPPAE